MSRRQLRLHFLDKKIGILTQISLKFAPNRAVDNKSSLIYILSGIISLASHDMKQSWPGSPTHNLNPSMHK